MAGLNLDDMLAELRHVVEENDLIKATILLNHVVDLDVKGQNQFVALLGT